MYVAPTSSWTPRVAIFAVGLLFCTILLHRLLGMPTPVALNLFTVAFVAAGLALVLGALAVWHIWTNGSEGAGYAAIGMIMAGGILCWPLAYLPVFVDAPVINDISTDPFQPPAFVSLASVRSSGGNGVAFDKDSFLRNQTQHYPDLKPLIVNRSAEDVFGLALEAIKRLRYDIAGQTSPTDKRPGYIEAVDRTLVIGFYDDVIVRVFGHGGEARIDVRSASRYGRHDFGRNALRARLMLSEIKSRVDASIPAESEAARTGTGGKDKAKAQKAGNRKSARPRRRPRSRGR